MSPKVYSALLFVLCAKSLQVNSFWTPRHTDSTSTITTTTFDPTGTGYTETDSTVTDSTATDFTATDSTGTYSTATDSTETDSTDPTPEEDQDTKGLLLFGNAESNLLVIHNHTAKDAIILDLNNNLISMGNGYRLRSIVIDIITRKGVYVASDDPKHKTISFRDFVSELKAGLKPYFHNENAIEFEVDDAPAMIHDFVNSILKNLLIGISNELENNPKEGLEIFVAVGSEILRLKKTTLRGSVQVLGMKGAFLHADLAGVYNAVEGLAIIIGRIPGGIPAILRAGGTINYPIIVKGRNGLEILAELLRGIGKAKDIGDILGNLFNNHPETLLRVVDLLGGSISNGLAGVLRVAAAAAQFANKEKSLEYTINVILQFLAANSQSDLDPKELSNQLTLSITILLEAIDEVHLSESLFGAIEVLRALADEDLQINKVKISSLISILISAVNQPKELQTIVKVLIELREVIEIEESIVRLLIVLILNVNNPLGIELLERCGVPVDINTGGISGSILENILRSISDLIGRLSHDLYEGLCSVPALDRIVDAINSAISKCGVDKDLKEILSANEVAKSLIKAVLQVVGKLRLDVPDDTCSRVGETVETCARVNFYLNIDVNVTITEERGTIA